MSIRLSKSETESKQTTNLLNKSIPSYRQAYSDRTAWLMACMSQLAYIRFNSLFPIEQSKSYFIERINNLIDENRKEKFVQLIDLVGYDHQEERRILEEELETLEFRIIETFDQDGTQAILVSNNSWAILAFRGTEAMSISDIKADLKAATTKCDSGGRIHSGFSEAFGRVERKIQEKLHQEDIRKLPLFITGHSLGGALASIAAKKLKHNGGIAACYTFGSPRVGDDDWVSGIKTPIYRLVNAADCVTMLPPSSEVITFISWILSIHQVMIPIRRWLLSKFGGYIHCGDQRYLTNCRTAGDYGTVKLLPSVSFFRRVWGFLIKKWSWKKFLADHSIDIYRKKLMIYALHRNP